MTLSNSRMLCASVDTAILMPGRVRETRILGGKIEAVGAGIDLEKTTVLPGVGDDPLDVDFIAGTFQQQASRRVSQDIEIPVIHGAHDALGLLGLPETEAGVDGADRIIEFPQEVVRIIQRSIHKDIHFG